MIWICCLLSLFAVLGCSKDSKPTVQSQKNVSNIQTDGSGLSDHLKQQRTGGLDEVIQKRYIRILTTSNSFDYFIHEGHARGYQYEMAKAFIDHVNDKFLNNDPLKIQFELVPLKRDQLIPGLLAGKGDFIAADIAETPDVSQSVAFSKPYRTVDQWVVTHLPAEQFRSIEDFSSKRLALQKSSPSYLKILEINEKLKTKGKPPIQIELVDEDLETENLLELVSLKKYDFTIADSHIAEIGLVVFQNLKRVRKISLGKPMKISWVVQKKSKKMLREINDFLPKFKVGTEPGNVTLHRYYRDFNLIKSNLEKGGKKNSLSAFDHWIQKYSQEYGLDWRLMAALCYQESHFNPEARSDQGAVGLFQIKPQTAAEPYVGIPQIAGIENIENNIHAGIKYFAWIKKSHFDPIAELSEKEKLRMTLAAYNAGPSTILRARDMTLQMGLDPNQWFRHVEMATIAIDRVQSIKYVSEINKHYVSYVIYGIEAHPSESHK